MSDRLKWQKEYNDAFDRVCRRIGLSSGDAVVEFAQGLEDTPEERRLLFESKSLSVDGQEPLGHRRDARVITRGLLLRSRFFELIGQELDSLGGAIADRTWHDFCQLSCFPERSRVAFSALLHCIRAYIEFESAPTVDPYALRNTLNETVRAIDELLDNAKSLQLLFHDEDNLITADRSWDDLSKRPAVRQLIIANAILRPISNRLNEQYEQFATRTKGRKSYAPVEVVQLLNEFSMEYRGRRLSRNQDNYDDTKWVAMFCGLFAEYGPGQIRTAMETVISKSISDIDEIIAKDRL